MVSACVLIVDDNPDVLDLLRALLELKGFQVVTAEDGDVAWEFLPQIRPDVIVTDMRMPRMDGGELIRRVRSAPGLDSVPIVAMSAYGPSDIAEATALGAAATLRKPTDFHRLVETIHDLLDEGTMPP